MAKKAGGMGALVTFVAWLTGVIVTLAVGFGLIDKVLRVWYIPTIVTQIAGWIVVVVTILGAIMAIAGRLK